EGVADDARAAGLVPRFGRKVLEIRPPIRADKGTAVRQLLAEAGLRRALYAGGDTTDLDAFRALDGLEVAVRVAVSSDEAPNELVVAAGIVVDSPAEFPPLPARRWPCSSPLLAPFDDLGELLDGCALPCFAVRGERLAQGAELERGHAHPFRSWELVVRPVADEQAVARLDPELLARKRIDLRVRLREADLAREDSRV